MTKHKIFMSLYQFSGEVRVEKHVAWLNFTIINKKINKLLLYPSRAMREAGFSSERLRTFRVPSNIS
jgi:hypothetical protein